MCIQFVYCIMQIFCVITFLNIPTLFSFERGISKFATVIVFLAVSPFISNRLGFIYLADVLFSAYKFMTTVSAVSFL